MSDERNLRIQVILGAVDRLTRPLKVVQGEAKKAGAALTMARRRVQELNAQKAKLDGFAKAKREAADLSAKLEGARGRATQLGREFARTDKPTRELARDFKAVRREVTDLEREQRSHQGRLNALRGELDKAGHSTLELDRHQRELRRDLHGATAEYDRQKVALEAVTARQKRLHAAEAQREKMRALSDRMTGAGLKMEVAGAGLAAPFVMATKAAIDFEARLANVRKIYDFTSQEANALAREGVRLGIDAGGMADIASQGAMGGVTRKDLIAFSKDAALMKEALNFDSAKEAGETASGWRHAFNFQSESQVTELGDVVTALTRKWGAKGGRGAEVADVLSRVGAIGAIAGSGTRQTAALASVLSSQNVPVDVAATGIKNLLLRMNAGVAATARQKKAFSELGLEATAVSARMQTDAGGAISDLLGRVNKLPKAMQSGVLMQMFGRESIAPIGMLAGRLDRVQAALALVTDKGQTAGQMQVEFVRKTATTAFGIEKAKAQAELLAITVGTQLLPAVNRFADGAGRVLGRVTAWASAHPRLTKAITMAALALSALLMVGGGLTLLVASLLGPFVMLNMAFAAGSPAMLLFSRAGGFVARAVLGMIAPLLEFTAALLTCPITWIVAGIAVLAAAAFLVVKNWKPISAFFGRLWAGVKAAFQGFLDWLMGLGGSFLRAGENLGKSLADGLRKHVPGAGALMDWLSGKGAGAGADLKAKGARVAAAVAVGAAAARGAPVAAQGQKVEIHHHGAPIAIHVHAAPGQEPHHIAKAVADELDKRHRAQAARARSRYPDGGREA